MMPEKWKSCTLLLIFMLSYASGNAANFAGDFVGINIGTDISNLPKATNIVSILQTKQIKHVRLFDADHRMLDALANTGIEVIVGIPNDQLLRIGSSRTEAVEWIDKNIASFVPATNITYITVGNEVLTTIPNAGHLLVPAMQFLHSALLAANLNSQVKISSPQSMEMIPKPFPPSGAAFNSTWTSIMHQFLQFLKNTGSSFMLNAHPYIGYTEGEGIFPIEYALFQSIAPNKKIIDPNTLLYYTNMFDAMVDAAYYSMKAHKFSGIPVIVTESGWPRLGGANEPDAKVDNAFLYNRNLIQHVLKGSGTPGNPTTEISAYIYELFNEDLRPGPLSEKNWGIVFPNGTTMYSLNFQREADAASSPPGLIGVFCVAKGTADVQALKDGLDWACGLASANCSAIQPGEPCYDGTNIATLASYAYNDYYHRTHPQGGTCDFSNTATLTKTDPSHGSCIFAGSLGSSASASNGTNPNPGVGGGSDSGIQDSNLGPSSFINGVSALQVLKFTYLIPVIYLLWS